MDQWRQDPIRFYHDVWGGSVVHWDKFEEVARAVANHRRVVVPSGHGVGKTFDAAHIAAWWLNVFHPAKVITTAPTWPQVEKLLWSEIRTAYSQSKLKLGGRVLQTEIKIADDWFAIGLSPRQDNETKEFGTQTLQGYHSPNLLIILDEAAAIPKAIFTAAEALVVGGHNHILAIGNPTSPAGPFYEACRSPLWHKIKISSFDHPNVKTGKIVVPGAVTQEWIDDRKKEWGENSSLYIAKVLGEFPPEGEDTLVPLSWVELAITNDSARTGSRRLSCDVARKGDDKTVILDMDGRRTVSLDKYTKQNTAVTSGRLITKLKKRQYDAVAIDDVGLGGGVTDNLVDQGYEVEAFLGGGRPREPDRFEMTRDEAYWVMREAFQPDSHGKSHLQIPDDEDLKLQLTSVKWRVNRRGKIQVESKADMKKRGLKSPDEMDALAMNLYYEAIHAEDDPGEDGYISMMA